MQGRAEELQRWRSALINTENWDKSPGSGLSAPLFGEKGQAKGKRGKEIERRDDKLLKPDESSVVASSAVGGRVDS